MNPNYPPPPDSVASQPMHASSGTHGYHHSHSQPPPQAPHHHLPPIPPPYPPPPQDDAPGNGLAPMHPPVTPSMASVPGQRLESISKIDEATNRRYSLDVVQQPKRARMCGFGDKDRRPITPPPCVRLVVTDVITGKEVDCNEIDHSMYVINVDLWSEDGDREVNLVRHSSATPSISSTTAVSFASMLDANAPSYAPILPSNRDGPYGGSQPPIGYPQQGGYSLAQSGYQQPPSPYVANAYSPANQFYPDFRGDGSVVPSQSGLGGAFGAPRYGGDPQALGRMPMGGPGPQGMFTRNLIGSLAASAFRLTDPQNRIGIWFVLQDLSVRTEGNFRLRFSFVNVGPPSTAPNGSATNQNSILNTGKAPVMAAVFSDMFTVYSAKKFPGVCESTALSKSFASQGIKIPIRKESSGKGDDDDDY